ncbi:dipeptidase [soil metagenome]
MLAHDLEHARHASFEGTCLHWRGASRRGAVTICIKLNQLHGNTRIACVSFRLFLISHPNMLCSEVVLKHLTALSLIAALLVPAQVMPAQSDDAALIAKAKLIHSRVIPLDTHNDIDASNFTPECNYTMRLSTQVNLPKMVEGGMDVSFMIVYVGQGPLTPEGYDSAYKQAIEKFDAIHRLTEQIAPGQIGLALTPADVLALHKQGKKIAVIGVENGYPIGLDVKRVKEFYDRGARYMSLAHNGNSQLADSNTGEKDGYSYGNGLSPEGKEVIAEMNKWGIMVDLSHPAKGANLEAIKLSKAPVIASHSAVRALAPSVTRDMDDEQLLALKKNGGVIQVVGFASYLKSESPERTEALTKLREDIFGPAMAAARGAGAGARAERPARACPVESADNLQGRRGGGGALGAFLSTLSPEKRAEYQTRSAEIDAKYPPAPRANVKDLVNHIDYAVKLIGIEHVGIASDFDGGGGIDGWNSAAESFNVTLELVRRGYTEKQIAKLWSENLLRVWGDVQKEAQKEQASKK